MTSKSDLRIRIARLQGELDLQIRREVEARSELERLRYAQSESGEAKQARRERQLQDFINRNRDNLSITQLKDLTDQLIEISKVAWEE